MQIFCKTKTPFSLANLFFITLLFFFGISSCANNKEANSDNSNQSANAAIRENSIIEKDDVAEFGSIVNLSELPEEAVWREEQIHNPEGKKLTAVLRYSSENAARIIVSAEKFAPPAPVEIGTEDWFPVELTAQSQLSGNESLKGTAYGANDFFSASYQKGRIIRVEKTDYFILEMTTD